jgi:hypothetical protein
LGDFFRQMGVTKLAQSDGINQIDMPRHQRGKRFLGIALNIFLQQRHVIGIHFTDVLPQTGQRLHLFIGLQTQCAWHGRYLTGLDHWQ